MKDLKIYGQLSLNNQADVFNYFIDNLRRTNRTFDFYVDWSKAFHNVDNIEIELNILNYLVGKTNIKKELYNLIEKYPNIVTVIPILIAIREKNIEVLTNFKTDNWEYQTFSFTKKTRYTPIEINVVLTTFHI